MTNAHYPSQLLKDYDVLMQFNPSHTVCRPKLVEAVQEWKIRYVKDNISILEIGPGNGETTHFLLEAIPCSMTLIESDKQSADDLYAKLGKYKEQITVINEDATRWIKEQPAETYDVFTASWVIHNFPTVEREAFLAEVARILKPGGLFIIFDKVLPDDQEESERLWKIHTERQQGLDALGKKELREAMFEHETRDMNEPYVWRESDLFSTFEKLGFKNMNIDTRCERDVVFSAVKK